MGCYTQQTLKFLLFSLGKEVSELLVYYEPSLLQLVCKRYNWGSFVLS